MKRKNIIRWTCDYSEDSGEGALAKKFINERFDKKKITIIKPQSKNLLSYKYITPLIGIYNCWKYYIKGHKIGYINYLPLWNFFIFILLPPKTIFGPITGGSNFTNIINISNFTRKFIFPLFYKISELFLNIRIKEKQKICFSTELLKQYLFNKTIKKSYFNYVFKNFKFYKKKKKKIDFLIYYRTHNNKMSFFNYQLIRKLIILNYVIVIVGDKLPIKGLKNKGYIKKKQILKLQSLSKYTISSGENVNSLFILESISNHVRILIEKKYINQVKLFRKYFISFNPKSFNLTNIKKIR